MFGVIAIKSYLCGLKLIHYFINSTKKYEKCP